MKRARLTRGALAPWSVAGLASLLVAVAALESQAQTGFYPYYGKNRVKYDHFEWHIYTTDHFEIYYYPELERTPRAGGQLRRECLRTDQRRS